MQCVVGTAKILPNAPLHVVKQSIDQDAGCKLPMAHDLWCWAHWWPTRLWVIAPLLARITRAMRQASSTRGQQLELTRLLHCRRVSMVQCIHSIYLCLL